MRSSVPLPAKHSESICQSDTIGCKAGNVMCSSFITFMEITEGSTSAVMPCEICCAEPQFCRECCCILCSKTVTSYYRGYRYVKCQAIVGEGYRCGHVAHIDCALRSNLAGTVGGHNGLDAEYYCRRCDARTDLVPYVNSLLKNWEDIDSRDELDEILNIGLCILRGSRRIGTGELLNRVELAMAKLKCGDSLEDIFKVEDATQVISGVDIQFPGDFSIMMASSLPSQVKKLLLPQDKLALSNMAPLSVMDMSLTNMMKSLTSALYTRDEMVKMCDEEGFFKQPSVDFERVKEGQLAAEEEAERTTEATTSRIQELETMLKNLQQLNQTSHAQVSDLSKLLAEVSNLNELTNKKLAELEGVNAQISSNLLRSEEEREIAKAEVARLNTVMAELQKNHKEECDTLKAKVANFKGAEAKQIVEISRVEGMLKFLQASVEKLQGEVTDVKENLLNDLKALRVKLKMNKEDVDKEKDALRHEIKMIGGVAAVKAKLELFQEFKDGKAGEWDVDGEIAKCQAILGLDEEE